MIITSFLNKLEIWALFLSTFLVASRTSAGLILPKCVTFHLSRSTVIVQSPQKIGSIFAPDTLVLETN